MAGPLDLGEPCREDGTHPYKDRVGILCAQAEVRGEHPDPGTTVAQVNEILAKLICYNLTVVVHEMFESGIAPNFVKKNEGA